MGLFGSICRGIGRAIGGGIAKVGEVLGSTTIRRFGENIQDACAEKIGSEQSYDKKVSNINSTERLNDILVEFSEGYLQQATAIENSCIHIVEGFFDSIIDMLESVPELSDNRAELNALKKEKTKIRKTISGTVKNPLSRRMSLDDAECLRILKMDRGSEKTRAMSAFSGKVIDEALDNLARTVTENLQDQLSDVQEYLDGISEEQEKQYAMLKEKLKKLSESGETETFEREQHCVEPLLILDAAETVRGILK